MDNVYLTKNNCYGEYTILLEGKCWKKHSELLNSELCINR